MLCRCHTIWRNLRSGLTRYLGGPVPDLTARQAVCGFGGGLRRTPDSDITPEKAANWMDGPYPDPDPISLFGYLTSGPVSDPHRNSQGAWSSPIPDVIS